MHATCPPHYRLVNIFKFSQLLRLRYTIRYKIISIEAISMLMRCKSYRKQAEMLYDL